MNVELDIEEEDLINYYKNQWLIEWIKKYHPELFEEAESFAKQYVKDNEK